MEYGLAVGRNAVEVPGRVHVPSLRPRCRPRDRILGSVQRPTRERRELVQAVLSEQFLKCRKILQILLRMTLR